jgi:CubicO group peptidase (beta-lactamase class C family)
VRRARLAPLALPLALIALAALLPAVATAGEASDMQRAVQTLASAGHFMGSVLIARGGHILLDRGYGDANLELKVADAPATKYRLGSITKQFTAAAILLLQQRGQLALNDPVKKYLPDAPASWSGITIFNLLTHTSGIPNYSDLPEFDATKALPATPAQLIARFRDQPLQFPPGTAWRYTNSGYALLGYLIERISGEPYAQFLRENIFEPLGMHDTGYDSNAAIIAGRAEGYTPGDNGAPINAQYIDMSVPYAAGGLYSTTHDLLRWEQALYGGRLLSADSLRQMTTPFMNNYALGIMVRKIPDVGTLYSHGGGIYGFNGEVSYVPSAQLAVIVLANLNGPAPQILSRQLLSIALHVPDIGPPPRPQPPPAGADGQDQEQPLSD